MNTLIWKIVGVRPSRRQPGRRFHLMLRFYETPEGSVFYKNFRVSTIRAIPLSKEG